MCPIWQLAIHHTGLIVDLLLLACIHVYVHSSVHVCLCACLLARPACSCINSVFYFPAPHQPVLDVLLPSPWCDQPSGGEGAGQGDGCLQDLGHGWGRISQLGGVSTGEEQKFKHEKFLTTISLWANCHTQAVLNHDYYLNKLLFQP